MEWTDRGIVIGVRKHGESSAIVELLTAGHGRHLGLVHGGSGRRQRGNLQPGNGVDATWRARLAEHLGSYRIELRQATAASLLGEPDRLACLSAACAMASLVLPEREAHPAVYDALNTVIDALVSRELDWRVWAAVYVRWEVGLLRELGFGLDLERCAVTGTRDNLGYVSPRTGCAVSVEGAGGYRDRLLELPPFLINHGYSGIAARHIQQGFKLTGFFITRHVLEPHSWTMPPARGRFADRALKFPDSG
ncbi:MAG: DNA repair protein RecO [Sphingomonadales bacterium]